MIIDYQTRFIDFRRQLRGALHRMRPWLTALSLFCLCILGPAHRLGKVCCHGFSSAHACATSSCCMPDHDAGLEPLHHESDTHVSEPCVLCRLLAVTHAQVQLVHSVVWRLSECDRLIVTITSINSLADSISLSVRGPPKHCRYQFA
jgi:hypothetical protein